MSDLSLFYSSMSNVLNQWSDFKVSRNLYKSYFAMQKSNAKEAAESSAAKFMKEDTSTKKTSSSASAVKDRLKTYAGNMTSSVTKLDAAFKADEKTGEIDYDKAFSAAQDFVGSYNELYSSTRQSGNSSVSGKSQFIGNMTNAYSQKLDDVGISVGSDGKMSIDKDKFMSADADQLDKIFGKKNSFASFLSDQSKALAAFADSASYLNANTYTKTGQVASAQNASASSGFLYNQLF